MAHLIVQSPVVVKNQPTGFHGLWYPTSRPLPIWRKTIVPTCVRYETPLKNLNTPSNPCSRGNVISFSGFAGISGKNTKRYIPDFTPKPYFSNNYEYMRNRGNTFDTASSHHKLQGVDYFQGKNPVWPSTPQTLDGKEVTSASFAHNDTVCNVAKHVIYKPSNTSFSTQGAVDCSTRLWKLKYAERPELTQFQKKALKAQHLK
jgi:hypothetical protein